jgi:hypothetical protein
MPHASLKLIPGVDQNRTPALNEAAISESNLIRFMPDQQGQALPQKLGGWTQFIQTTQWDTVRALHAWSDTNTHKYLGIGADTSLQASESGNTAVNISPQYYTGNIPVSFTTTVGSAEVVITDTASNMTSYDSIYLETQVSVGGLVLSGFYTCQENGANTYSVFAKNVIGISTPATAAVTNGGAVPTFKTTISPSTPTVTVTLADHGYSVGSTFPILVATDIGGVTLYGNYIVTSVLSTSTFTIAASSAPTNVFTITSATWLASVATIGLNSLTTIPVGTSVVVAGMTPSGYNGTYTVTASSAGSFSYAKAANPGTATVFGTATAAAATFAMNGGKARITYFIGQQATTPPVGYGTGGYGDGGYGTGVVFSGNGRVYTGASIVGNGTTATVTLSTNVYVTPRTVIAITGSTNFNGTYTVISAVAGTSTSTFVISSTAAFTNTGVTVSVSKWGFEMPVISEPDWALDNWGEYLIASPHYGEIFYWNPSDTSGHAAVVPNAPLVNEGFFVAMPERQIIAYGSTFTGFQDPLLVRWCDVGNFTNWVGTVTNQAGSFRIPKGSKIVGGLQGPQQGLLWTDLGLWSMQYINLPLVYSFNEIASGCGLVGRKAAGTLAGTVYWMSQSQFFKLSGAGVEPIQCSIWDVVFQDIDTDYWENVVCAPNSRFGEVAWYYPSKLNIGTSLEGVATNYVKYNVLLGQWDYGTLSRTAWIDQGVNGPPIGAGGDYNIYQHETSNNANGTAMNSFFTTGYFAVEEGDLKTFLDQVWPDMKWGFYDGTQNATVTITFYTADYPGDTPREYSFTVTQGTQFVTPRFRARLVAIKIESNDLNSFWRLGNIRYRYQPDGKF